MIRNGLRYMLVLAVILVILPIASVGAYHDEEGKFSIDPPLGWAIEEADVTIQEGEATVLVQFLGPVEKGFRINFNIVIETLPFSVTAEEYWTKYGRDMFLDTFPDTQFLSEGPRTVGGLPAYESVKTYTYQGINIKGKQVCVVRDNVLVFTYSAKLETYSKYLDAFEQSLATFTFDEEIDQTTTAATPISIVIGLIIVIVIPAIAIALIILTIVKRRKPKPAPLPTFGPPPI